MDVLAAFSHATALRPMTLMSTLTYLRNTFMSSLDLDTLKPALKALIVKECDKDIDPAAIDDDAQLIGGELQLDSLDALQISLAVKDRYDVRIEGGNEGRKALASVSALAQFIIESRANHPATA
ncbi:MAG TPA: hypothetical protein VHL14_12690 [Steroidobacteraceae bacterium]|jgi:acyl carrier protein|nr:hypothetical protein [Steroidobacteraceae bacterium]